jgi:LemA protein
MSIELIILIIVIILVVAIASWTIATTNRFKILLIKIKESDSGIDVALTKRYDTLTKLIDVVKAYTKHETDLFERVIKLRSGMSVAEKSEVNHHMDETMGRINVLAENYPELRSSENYKQLQEAIMDAEDHLQASRRVYNMNVSSFNQSIAVFPASIIAGMAKHSSKDFFEIEEQKRADVKMNL